MLVKKLKAIFTTRLATIICWIVAISIRIISVCFASYVGTDKAFLLLQSKNLLAGQGLYITKYFIDNREIPEYTRSLLWPPGYPVLIAPFLKLFKYDTYLATTSFDIIFSIATIFVIRVISRQVGFPIAGANLITLLAGCFQYIYIGDSGSTDTVSIFFLLTGLLFTLKLLRGTKISIYQSLFTAFLLFSPSWFRYEYPAVASVVPIVIAIVGVCEKNHLFIKIARQLLLFIAIFLIAYYLLLNSIGMNLNSIFRTEKGIFFANIVRWAPVIPGSFINVSFLAIQCQRVFGIQYETTIIILEVINVLVFIVGSILFLLYFFRKRIAIKKHQFTWFIIIGFFISAAIIGELGFLSLTNQVQRNDSHEFNYIYEPRYFAFIFIYVQLAFLGWLFLYPECFKNVYAKGVAIVCCVLLFTEIMHNIYFNVKVVSNFAHYKASIKVEQDYAYFNKLIASLEKTHKNHDILVVAPGDLYFPLMACYNGKKGIHNPYDLNKGIHGVKTKTLVILVVTERKKNLFNDFFTNDQPALIGSAGGNNFYIKELLP